jgi:large subunit ribosomal protein L32e
MKGGKEPKTFSEERASRNRERVKNKKPDFRRQESWRYKRMKESWRRPRGIDSKMRKKAKGWPRSVEVGYRSPKKTRGFHPSGYAEALVYNVDDVEKVSPETQVIRIGGAVGARKRVEISARAEERGIHILNPREMKELEEVEEERKEKREEKVE